MNDLHRVSANRQFTGVATVATYQDIPRRRNTVKSTRRRDTIVKAASCTKQEKQARQARQECTTQEKRDMSWRNRLWRQDLQASKDAQRLGLAVALSGVYETWSL